MTNDQPIPVQPTTPQPIPVQTTDPKWPDWQKQLAAFVLVLFVPLTFIFFKPVLITLLFTFLLAYTLRYPINFLHRRLKLPYNIAVILVFFIFILLAMWAFIALTGAVISTAVNLVQELQTFINSHMPAPPPSLNVGPLDLSFLLAPLERWSGHFIVMRLFGGPSEIINGFSHLLSTAADLMGQFAIIVIILLFFLLEIPTTLGGIGRIFPENSRREYAILWQRFDTLLGKYLFGSLLIVGFYWLVAALLFAITGVSDPMIKGFIVAVPNFIPQVGGFISTILVFIIALISGSDTLAMSRLVFAFVLMIIFLLISGTAYYFVNARIYSKSVKLPIWLILVGLIVFSSLFGLLGFLLAAAVMGIFSELVVFTLKKIRGEDPYPGEPEPPLFTKYWK